MLLKHLLGNKVQHAHTEFNTQRIQRVMAVNGMTQRLTRIIVAGKTHVISMQVASVAVVAEARGIRLFVHNLQNRM